MKQVNLADLRTFEALAQLGHMGAAASHLGRTQPAISKCVDRLEASLGVALLERRGRGLVLTEAGRELLQEARLLRREADRVRHRMADLANGSAGIVRLGVGMPSLTYLLPTVLPGVLVEAPQVGFQLRIGTSEELHKALRNEEIDFAIGLLPGVEEADFETLELWAEDSGIVARRDHPLMRPGLTMHDLAGSRWALGPPAIGSRRWVEALLADSGLPPATVVIESTILALQPRILQATDLLSVMALKLVGANMPGDGLAALPLTDTILRRPFGLTWLARSYLSPVARTFIALVSERLP